MFHSLLPQRKMYSKTLLIFIYTDFHHVNDTYTKFTTKAVQDPRSHLYFIYTLQQPEKNFLHKQRSSSFKEVPRNLSLIQINRLENEEDTTHPVVLFSIQGTSEVYKIGCNLDAIVRL